MMPRLFLLVLALSLVACQDSTGPTASAHDLANHTGRVTEFNSVFLVIDDADGSPYLPSNLPEEFAHEGLRVLFSGNRQEIPPNVRLVGAPLELTKIELAPR